MWRVWMETKSDDRIYIINLGVCNCSEGEGDGVKLNLIIEYIIGSWGSAAIINVTGLK